MSKIKIKNILILLLIGLILNPYKIDNIEKCCNLINKLFKK